MTDSEISNYPEMILHPRSKDYIYILEGKTEEGVYITKIGSTSDLKRRWGELVKAFSEMPEIKMSWAARIDCSCEKGVHYPQIQIGAFGDCLFCDRTLLGIRVEKQVKDVFANKRASNLGTEVFTVSIGAVRLACLAAANENEVKLRKVFTGNFDKSLGSDL